MDPPLIIGPKGHYHEDDGSIEYDEHGNPTPAQLKRWDESRAAAANVWLKEVQETIEEARRERAADIAAGRKPKHLITRDQLLAAGALSDPSKRRKLLGGGPKRQLDLFDDEDTATAEQISDDGDAE